MKRVVKSLVVLLLASCQSGAPAGPMPLPAPSFVPLVDADCPVPDDIDEGRFRAALCPTLVTLANALRGRDMDALMSVAIDETIDCDQAIADEPEIVGEFPQCGGAPPPTISGYTWCAEPVGPTCELISRDEFATSIRGLLERADPAASDEVGSGEFRIVGFDLCGPTQIVRTTLIAAPAEEGAAPERWVMDFFLRTRPQVAEQPLTDNFTIRRVDAAPIAEWQRISAGPLSEGRCGELLPEPLLSESEE